MVVNAWVNRLIGDSKLPKELRRTWTATEAVAKDQGRSVSGLTGPVVLEMYK